MAEIMTQSWTTDEELEVLARARRNNEILTGVVRSVGFKEAKVLEGNKYVKKEMEVITFLLEGYIKAYCPATEFSEREYRSLIGFVGTKQEFIVTDIDLESRVAVVSVKQADAVKSERFWNELEYLEKKGELANQVYTGVISGFNPETERIFVRINGTDCFMLKYDWQHGRIRDIASQIERGATVQVKVQKFDKEQKLVHVSRKATMVDPYTLLEDLKDAEAVVGKVTAVDPIHGIYIMLDIGEEVKGMKPRTLEEPVVGDIVSCKIRRIDKAKRSTKVVIIGYPRGKKKRKDIGGFLFE
ncbi:S1 RNA-binding domain-containing protein [Ferdinandcohnia sp. SAFN-114]|uniref:S1 RNA-binding domain-containing protein n=1 Tax=Ferdinandcohnia sp. SAFN-114 TaxID=3387275 RepID=UPI003F7FEB85